MSNTKKMKSLLGHFLSKERTCAKKEKCLLEGRIFYSPLSDTSASFGSVLKYRKEVIIWKE